MVGRRSSFIGGLAVTLLFAGGAAAAPQGTPELPHCGAPIGTVAIEEPQRDWWSPLGLSNPEALIKLMAGRSNCLRVVARGQAMEMRQAERNLGDSGELQRGQNFGKGQVVAADYIIIMRAGPTPGATRVRDFKSGDLVYPTGQKNGVWWEVDDENGNRGWVTSTKISPRGH